MSKTPDKQQIIAVEHEGSPARVMAGAGTGKSTTMGLRVQNLIKRHGVPPHRIIVMTFTRKGAEEFRSKLTELIGQDDAIQVSVGTFHRIASTEVISYEKDKAAKETETSGKEVKSDRYHVLDDTDAEDLWLTAFTEVATEIFPGAFGEELFTGTKKGNKELEKKIKSIFKPLRELRSFQINQNLKHEDFGLYGLNKLTGKSAAVRDLQANPRCPNLANFINQSLVRYETIKQTNKARDYDDLIVTWRDLLRNDADYNWGVHQRWPHVIIDEYQDTNYLQEDIIGLLNTKNLVVVGDISQCIYSWRCAVPQLMIDFRDKYKARDIPLEYNYRSREEILEFANKVLQQHHEYLGRSSSIRDLPLLQLRGTRGSGGKVEIMPGLNKSDETTKVFKRITRMLDAGVLPKDIVVLCRTSYYMRELEAKVRGISYRNDPLPVQVWGGMSLLDSKTAKDLLSVLKCIVRPMDPFPFVRVAQLYPKIGETAAYTAFFRHMFCMPQEKVLDPFITGISDLIELNQKEVEGDGRNKLNEVISKVCDILTQAYSDSGLDEKELKSRLRELSDMKSGICEVIASSKDKITPSGQKIAPELTDIVDQYSLDPKRDKTIEEALTLSTVHQAKGLEWKHVILMGVGEGTLPIIRKDGAADIEEECRILYVASTRAKETLTMTYSIDTKRSRFLDAIPSIKKQCEILENKAMSPY